MPVETNPYNRIAKRGEVVSVEDALFTFVDQMEIRASHLYWERLTEEEMASLTNRGDIQSLSNAERLRLLQMTVLRRGLQDSGWQARSVDELDEILLDFYEDMAGQVVLDEIEKRIKFAEKNPTFSNGFLYLSVSFPLASAQDNLPYADIYYEDQTRLQSGYRGHDAKSVFGQIDSFGKISYLDVLKIAKKNWIEEWEEEYFDLDDDQ